MEIREFFNNFLEKKWNKDYAYTSSFFVKTYSFSPHITRYHLNRLVYTGKLICIKVYSRNYYMLPENFRRFEPYASLCNVSILKG